MNEGAPFPAIVGVPRSGTTLLRMMLDSHSQLAIPPETGFLIDRRIHIGAHPTEAARAMIDFPAGAPAWKDFGIDGSLVTSQHDRQAQQHNITNPLLSERDGAWERQFAFSRDQLSREALNLPTGRNRRLPLSFRQVDACNSALAVEYFGAST